MLPSYPLSYQPYFVFPSLVSQGTSIVKIRQSNYISQQWTLRYSKFPPSDSLSETKFKPRKHQSLTYGRSFSTAAFLQTLGVEHSIELRFI